MRRLPFRSERGFTLMEAVLVIVIVGIIGGMVAVFIRAPVLGYVQSASRVELSDAADTALRRIGRDVRLALANSVRRTTQGSDRVYLEFLLTKTGGRYRAADDGTGATGTPLSFTDTTSKTFTVVGPALPTDPTDAQKIVNDDKIVVYNLGPGMSPANAYADCAAGCNRATVDSVDYANNLITLVDNPFAAQATIAPNMIFPSPDNRFAVVESPVTYVCDKTARTLTRYWGYAIQSAQPANADDVPLANTNTKKALLAKDVIACDFSYDNAVTGLNSQRTGLVGLSLTLQDANGEMVTLFHQVHVDNTP
jgi:MSHA biogenesis protein MshO